MKAVEVTIENLHALDVIIIPNLKHLGRVHAKIKSFKICYLRVVEQAFEEVWARILKAEDISVPGFEDKFPIPPYKMSLHDSCNSLSRSQNSLKKYKNKNENPSTDCQNTTQSVTKKPVKKISKMDLYDGDTKEAWIQTISLITSKIIEGYNEGMEIRRLEEEKKVKELEDEVNKLKLQKEDEIKRKHEEDEDEIKRQQQRDEALQQVQQQSQDLEQKQQQQQKPKLQQSQQPQQQHKQQQQQQSEVDVSPERVEISLNNLQNHCSEKANLNSSNGSKSAGMDPK